MLSADGKPNLIKSDSQHAPMTTSNDFKMKLRDVRNSTFKTGRRNDEI
jgi:hypothetical protein